MRYLLLALSDLPPGIARLSLLEVGRFLKNKIAGPLCVSMPLCLRGTDHADYSALHIAKTKSGHPREIVSLEICLIPTYVLILSVVGMT